MQVIMKSDIGRMRKVNQDYVRCYQKSDHECLVVLFDRIIYTSDQNTAKDSLVKLRTVGNVELMPLYEHLQKCFSDKYELIDMSRYERALYKLAQSEENSEDC